MEVIGGLLFLAVLLGFLALWVWSLGDAIPVADDSAVRVYLAVGRPRPA